GGVRGVNRSGRRGRPDLYLRRVTKRESARDGDVIAWAPREQAMRSEEKEATSPSSRYLKWTVATIAVAMSLYHMYVAAFGPPEAITFRATHLLFALTLVFLLYPTVPTGPRGGRLVDAVLLGAGWGFVLHLFLNFEYYTNRIIYIDE